MLRVAIDKRSSNRPVIDKDFVCQCHTYASILSYHMVYKRSFTEQVGAFGVSTLTASFKPKCNKNGRIRKDPGH